MLYMKSSDKKSLFTENDFALLGTFIREFAFQDFDLLEPCFFLEPIGLICERKHQINSAGFYSFFCLVGHIV